MKKSFKTMFIESFTKSFDERYAEMSKGEKLGHWIFMGTLIFIMALMFIFGN